MSIPTSTRVSDVFEVRVTPQPETGQTGGQRLFVGYFASIADLTAEVVGQDVDDLFDGTEHRVRRGNFLVEVAPLPTLAGTVSVASADALSEALDVDDTGHGFLDDEDPSA